MSRRTFLVASAAVCAASVLAACGQRKPQFKAIDLTGADYARDLRLPDADGHERSLKDFRGKVVVLFFGYTQCPDVCPTTLSEIAQAKQLLGADGARLQGVFVTLDPERDTPQVLKAYLANFDPTFVALRGTLQQTAAVAKDFKIFYQKVPGKTPGSYTLDHSAAAYVYDPDGRLRLYTRYGSGPQALASDVKLLLDEAA
jgi:protein SCO1